MMDWTRAAFLAMEWLWLLSGILCLIAAGLAATGRLDPDRVELHMQRTLGRWPSAAILAAAMFFPAALSLYKLAQFHAFHIMMDSAVMGNVMWNAAHGHGLVSSIYAGKSYLAVHFAFTLALLAPLTWIWNSMGLLAVAHGLAVGSCVPAAFLLGRLLGRSAWCGVLAALLCVSSPFFQNTAISLIDNVNFAAPIFLWGAWAWAAGRRKSAALLALLLLTTREQAPILLAGVGAYGLAQARDKRGRGGSIALILTCVLLWFFEMRVIESAKAGQEQFFNFWSLYSPLGASPKEILRNLFLKPWIFAYAMVWPPEKFLTIGRVFGWAGLLPLFSGWAILPLLSAWIPHQLADPASHFHQLREHYAALILGPLLWSSICALASMNLAAAGWRRGSTIWVLIVSGVSLTVHGDFRPPEGVLPSSWRENVPIAARYVPSDAKLWCDEYLSPHFAMRQYIKVLPQVSQADFETALFLPDRILLSRHWIARSEAGHLRRFFGFLRRHKFVRLFEQGELVVLARPGTEDGSVGPIQWVTLAQ